MFRITKNGATVGMTESPNYIRQQENGCFALCPEPLASGIVFEGTVYHLMGRDTLEGAETVMHNGFRPLQGIPPHQVVNRSFKDNARSQRLRAKGKTPIFLLSDIVGAFRHANSGPVFCDSEHLLAPPKKIA